jgi:hypothetical protein
MRSEGLYLQDAKFAAVSALVRFMREKGPLPTYPMDLETVRRSEEWLSQNHIDLSKAVVSMVPLAA